MVDLAQSKCTSDLVFEIRYVPNPKILDYRGKWVSEISTEMQLHKWEITDNRISVTDAEKSELGFVSFKNAGFSTKNRQNPEAFKNRVKKFFRYFMDDSDFRESLIIERIGLRYRYAFPYSSFDEILNKFRKRFCIYSESLIDNFAGDIVDVGYNTTIQLPKSFITTTIGPMKSEQIIEYFDFEKSPPNTALYLDFDNWSRPKKEFNKNELFSCLDHFSDENKERITRIADLFLE
jgi:hypothetical protein